MPKEEVKVANAPKDLLTKVNDYSLQTIKKIISDYRRGGSWILDVVVTLPVEVEASIISLQENYGAECLFQIGLIDYGTLLINPVVEK